MHLGKDPVGDTLKLRSLDIPSPHIDGNENQVVIQYSLNELLEIVPAVPRLHRMNVLRKEHDWEEGTRMMMMMMMMRISAR